MFHIYIIIYHILWHLLHQDHRIVIVKTGFSYQCMRFLSFGGANVSTKSFLWFLSNLFQWHWPSHLFLPYTAEWKKHSKRITCCFIAEPHRPIKVPQNNSSACDSGACFLKWPDWVNNFLLQLLILLADKYGPHIVHLEDFNWFDCQEQATARLTFSSALKLWQRSFLMQHKHKSFTETNRKVFWLNRAVCQHYVDTHLCF